MWFKPLNIKRPIRRPSDRIATRKIAAVFVEYSCGAAIDGLENRPRMRRRGQFIPKTWDVYGPVARRNASRISDWVFKTGHVNPELGGGGMHLPATFCWDQQLLSGRSGLRTNL